MELLDRPFFPRHLYILTIEINFTVVHDQLRGIWGGRGLVREVHDGNVVHCEREVVFLEVVINGKLPILLIVRDYDRVYRWVVEASK